MKLYKSQMKARWKSDENLPKKNQIEAVLKSDGSHKEVGRKLGRIRTEAKCNDLVLF